MDERNAVLAEFKSETDILISTDAGGEGLNLQFSNCVINYDLPWNPMKIEQRI
jgi:superfamily II DNA/RNA helicase